MLPLPTCGLMTVSLFLKHIVSAHYAWHRQSLSNTNRDPAGIAYKVPSTKSRSPACSRQGVMSRGEGWKREGTYHARMRLCFIVAVIVLRSASYTSFLNLTTWSLSKQLAK